MRYFSIGTALILAAACFLVFSAARYNLAVAEPVPEQNRAVIVIDAGHGGEDGGATGITGVSESQLNLQVALRLEQLLQFCGYDTHMIRTTDTAVYTGNCSSITEKKVSDLKNRVRIVNQLQSAIFISIHQNHFSEEKYYGSQVFFANDSTSKQFALYAQEALRVALDANNHRQCKQADSIYLMEHIRCPGILVECGFLSNRAEALLLEQPDYQKKIVCAIARGLAQMTQEGENQLEV